MQSALSAPRRTLARYGYNPR
ncbi:MAG: hypothetical protein ACR65R_07235 [Methylomicrobium sp.]